MTDPVVAHVVRNGFVESVHHGRLVVVDSAGGVLEAVGDVAEPMFPRSVLKPFQIVALLRAGWQPADEAELAVATASHSGAPEHIAVVRRILVAAGLDERALANTPDWPYDAAVQRAYAATGGQADSLHQNCSGKHAAMLATCVAAGWPTDGYLDPGHPVQLAVRAAVEEFTGEAVAAVAVDGCGAPLFAVSLAGLARAFASLQASPSPAASSVADAMRARPDLVGGTGRDVTGLMSGVPGLIAKDGAEGVFAAATADGAVAIKIADGAARARVAVLLRGLATLGVDVAPLAHLVPPVLGHGEPVGTVVPAGALAG